MIEIEELRSSLGMLQIRYNIWGFPIDSHHMQE
jgi:hypothetical protein